MADAPLVAIFREKSEVPITQERLAALVREGREAWPKVTLPSELFVGHLARHVTEAVSWDKLRGTDLYLACALLHRDRAAQTYFEENFMARVPDYVSRVRAGREFVDEVQQKVREMLLLGSEEKGPKIADYSGRGPLGGWLRITATRTALNMIRAEAPSSEDVGEIKAVSGDPELAYVKEIASDLFQQAFKQVLEGLDAQGRTMLRLHYIDGLTMDQLSQLYKTPRSTVARRVAEVRQKVLQGTEELLREEKRLSPSAVASVLRQAASRLDVTITRILR